MAEQWPDHRPLIDTLRAQYAHRAGHLDEAIDRAAGEPGAAERELLEHQEIRGALIEAERATVLDLRERGEISDHVWRRIQRDLDLEDLRMEA